MHTWYIVLSALHKICIHIYKWQWFAELVIFVGMMIKAAKLPFFSSSNLSIYARWTIIFEIFIKWHLNSLLAVFTSSFFYCTFTATSSLSLTHIHWITLLPFPAYKMHGISCTAWNNIVENICQFTLVKR